MNYNIIFNKLDYILVFLLVMLSGNPALSWEWQYVMCAALLYIVILRKNNMEKPFKQMIFLSVIIFFCQFIIFGWNSFPAIVNFLSKITVGYAVVVALGNKFRYTYLRVMYHLSIVALVFFLIELATGYQPGIEVSENYSSIFLWGTHLDSESIRNDGPFWEPGAFAGYLVLSFLLFSNDLRTALKANKREFITITLALITTFSTTGYIVLMVIGAYYFLTRSKNKAVLFITIPIMILLGSYIIGQDFVGEKITEQLELSKDTDINSSRVDHGRFSSAIFDWYYIQKHPIVGNGLHSRTRYEDHLYMGENLVGFGNGFTGFVACMGIIFMIFYLSLFLQKNNKGKFFGGQWFCILIVVLLLQGEQYLNYPMFFALPFVIRRISINQQYDS